MTIFNTTTGDQAQVNKGFMDSMFFDQSVQNEEEDDQERYAFLAQNEDLDAAQVDFSDQAALLRRQRMILEQITTHKANQKSNFDPLKLLRKSSATQDVAEEESQ